MPTSSPLHFLSVLLFICVISQTTLPLLVNSSKCHPDDESALLAFKSSLASDPSGLLATWQPNTDCCQWNGITCLVSNRVTALTLYGNSSDPRQSLRGSLSPALGNLSFLGGIYIQNHPFITGTFPDFLFRLPLLKYVYIENDNLHGQLPVNIGRLSILEALGLAGNHFAGPIPTSVSALTQLTQLNLGRNLLSGTIPVGIRQLKNLTFLSLEGNRLSGAIPDVFTSFSSLVSLQLSHNQLSGVLPPTISALAPRLRYLELGHNKLGGRIPDYLGKFKSLDTLDLSSNRFSGVVPKSFDNLTKIFNLDLSRNNLADPFPEMHVKGIESLDLSYNHFSLGKIPSWVTSSPIIYSLKLARCGIKMRLDDWKPSETYFYDYIDLSENEITGSPIELMNRTNFLVGFWADGNQLRFNMSKLPLPKTLKFLGLSRNSVFGKLPDGISSLETLNVSHNHLCGRIPAAKFLASAFLGNDCLCGSPLPSCRN
ncbi:hypothetical protein ACLOJK_009077 [Asimina triloba]